MMIGFGAGREAAPQDVVLAKLCSEFCYGGRRRRMAAATAAALASSILSRLASAASARIDLDRAIRPSNTTHSASAIDEIASITSSDGSSRSRLLSLERASVLPIRPSAHAA